jgi:hypothetical protein
MKKACCLLIWVTMLTLSACASATSVSTTQPLTADQAATIAAATLQAVPTNVPTPTPRPAVESIVVTFVKDGDVHVWNSTTQQSEMIFPADDANMVTLSEDGQLIVFLRHVIDSSQCEQTALWVVERSGENAREILSPVEMRSSLSTVECPSPPVIINRIEWLPESHRLVFSLLLDHEHSYPQGLYLADADSLETNMLVPADLSFHFVPSPDGQQVALMSTSGLSFINTDGSNWRQDVVTYPRSGIPLPGFANGVWTLDSQAFLLATYGDNGLNITRVPLDGSPPELLITNANTNRDSVAFSPNGLHVGFVDGSHHSSNGQFDLPWVIQQLGTAGAGPLAIPSRTEFGTPANLHWSPANVAYVYVGGNLYPFCPNAAPDYDVCDTVTPGYVSFYIVQWLDAERFLFLTREPSLLFLGALDHTTAPIVIWPLEEWVTPQNFSAVLLSPDP